MRFVTKTYMYYKYKRNKQNIVFQREKSNCAQFKNRFTPLQLKLHVLIIDVSSHRELGPPVDLKVIGYWSRKQYREKVHIPEFVV